jgi:hypothetical protein
MKKGFTQHPDVHMLMPAQKRNLGAGFTLIETVVLIGISAIALTAIVNLFIIFNSLYSYQHAFIKTAGSSGATLNALQAAVLPADAVLVLHTFSGMTLQSGTTTLVLELPTVNSAGAFVAGARDYVAFYASSTDLYRVVEANAQSVRVSGATLLSSTLDTLAFTYDSSDFAQVTRVTAAITTSGHFKEQSVSSELTESWYLRNRP